MPRLIHYLHKNQSITGIEPRYGPLGNNSLWRASMRLVCNMTTTLYDGQCDQIWRYFWKFEVFDNLLRVCAVPIKQNFEPTLANFFVELKKDVADIFIYISRPISRLIRKRRAYLGLLFITILLGTYIALFNVVSLMSILVTLYRSCGDRWITSILWKSGISQSVL